MLKKLEFHEGEVRLLGQRIVLGPRDAVNAFTKYLIAKPAEVPVIYELIRVSFESGWAEQVKKVYGFQSKDYFRWLIDISNIAGWGKSELVQFDESSLTGTFRTENALVGSSFKGQVSSPVDHIWRGLTAGGLTAVFGQDIDWIETKCIATGQPVCEFIFKPRAHFKGAEDSLVKQQLPLDKINTG
jgi:hypothetical protein